MRHEPPGRTFTRAVYFQEPKLTTSRQSAKVNFLLVALLSQLLLLASLPAAVCSAERKALSPVGEIVLVTGKVSVRLTPEDAFTEAKARQTLVVGDIIKTGPNGRASILLREETQLKVASNTTLIIKDVTAHKEKSGAFKTLLKLESGEVWTRSKGAGEGLMIETPNATAAIRGTEWSISVRDNESKVIVSEGKVQMSNKSGTVNLGQNEQGIIIGDEAPVKSLVISPRDRIQWTYYLSEKKLLGYLKFREAAPGTAEVLFNEGKLEESTRAFREVLAGDPDNYKALAGLGLAALKRGKTEDARGFIDRSLNIKESLPALLGRAYLSISDNMTEDAARDLQHAKVSYTADPLPYIFSSYLYTFQGDFSSALEECDRGLAIMPDNPLILAFKTDIYFILNKPDEVKKTIDTLLEHNPNASGGHEKIGFYHRLITGDSKSAEGSLRKAMALNPADDEAISKLADLLREQGYIPQSLKLIQEALSLAPWNAMNHYIYGRLLADINRIDEARAEFDNALDLDPAFSRAYLGVGIVLLKEGRTDEAFKELSKASMFEPNLSEVHSFLAIAHYQRHNVSAALDELRRAEECDPLDSTPHQLASTIYNDIYKPVEAIEESKKVMELLPYRKASGEALLESSKNGAMSVNYGLDFLNLSEWSLYYARKALFVNPYSNTTHLGIALAYDQIGSVSSLQGFNEYANPASSEYLQGYIFDINSLNFSNRYRTLISKPGHYLTLGGTYADGDSEQKQADITASGDFGSKHPLTYWMNSSFYDDSGYLDNSRDKVLAAEVTLGYKPRYDNDIYLDVGYNKEKTGVPVMASQWFPLPEYGFRRDDNQETDQNFYWLQLGYHKRFGPESHLLASLRYAQINSNLENRDADDPEHDSSGFSGQTSRIFNTAVGIKHMITLFDNHQFSYGLDWSHVKLDTSSGWPLFPGFLTQKISSSYTTQSTVFHIYDRWAVSPNVTLDAGLFFTHYSPGIELNSEKNMLGSVESSHNSISKDSYLINPRVGITYNLGEKGAVRVAYQKRSATSFLGELEPVGTSGLVPPTFDIAYSEAKDLEASVEYELGKNTFVRALGGYEKLSDLISGSGTSQLWYGRFALNQIIGKNFSFSLRYHYNNSQVLGTKDRELYGIPTHSGAARLTFVHPREIYMTLRESYIGDRFADKANKIRLRGYLLTDFYAQKEFLKKRVFVSFEVDNIFNQRYKTIDYPFSWFTGALPGRGTTVMLRIEYRL